MYVFFFHSMPTVQCPKIPSKAQNPNGPSINRRSKLALNSIELVWLSGNQTVQKSTQCSALNIERYFTENINFMNSCFIVLILQKINEKRNVFYFISKKKIVATKNPRKWKSLFTLSVESQILQNKVSFLKTRTLSFSYQW